MSKRLFLGRRAGEALDCARHMTKVRRRHRPTGRPCPRVLFLLFSLFFFLSNCIGQVSRDCMSPPSCPCWLRRCCQTTHVSMVHLAIFEQQKRRYNLIPFCSFCWSIRDYQNIQLSVLLCTMRKGITPAKPTIYILFADVDVRDIWSARPR